MTERTVDWSCPHCGKTNSTKVPVGEHGGWVVVQCADEVRGWASPCYERTVLDIEIRTRVTTRKIC